MIRASPGRRHVAFKVFDGEIILELRLKNVGPLWWSETLAFDIQIGERG
jgi:hypothetical protein